jgi:glutathione synthase
MPIKLGVIMDPIGSIHYEKDTTLAMMLEATRREYEISYFELNSLFLRDGKAFGRARPLKVIADPSHWFELGIEAPIPLATLDVILMRKDPPFDMNYLFATHLLDAAMREGVFVVNKPQGLRDANEKIFATNFAQCCPPTLVTQRIEDLKKFLYEQNEIVCKPLDAMGGRSVFYLRYPDLNASVVFETLTQEGSAYMMAQRFIPEIKLGDKRIILINGEPVPFALARKPAEGELRGNLAAGGKGTVIALSERDHWICTEIAPVLRDKGLYFVGIDVIGDYLTEINVTSPTCVREIEISTGINVCVSFFDFIESKL